jgi:hypothetical protein
VKLVSCRSWWVGPLGVFGGCESSFRVSIGGGSGGIDSSKLRLLTTTAIFTEICGVQDCVANIGGLDCRTNSREVSG